MLRIQANGVKEGRDFVLKDMVSLGMITQVRRMPIGTADWWNGHMKKINLRIEGYV
ncbi:MAG: hypothetical protein IKQ97_08135 [Eubacterium sp.]|nr:hypothetical protein [Eubacterium sp.]